MEDAFVVAATASGTIELFNREPGGMKLTLLARWERPRRATWGLASTLVGLLQAMLESFNAEDWAGHYAAPYAARLVNSGLVAVGFERTYMCEAFPLQ